MPGPGAAALHSSLHLLDACQASISVRLCIRLQLQTSCLCRCLACRDGGAGLQELTEQQQDTQLQCYFLFSLVWSLGANTDAEGRAIFDGLLRKLISKNTPPELAPFVTAPDVGALLSVMQCATCHARGLRAVCAHAYGDDGSKQPYQATACKRPA
jgi:hypothetical protein